jgi:hypothetical protein
MGLDVYSGLFDDDLGAFTERVDAALDAHQTSRTVSTVWAREPVVTISNQASSR